MEAVFSQNSSQNRILETSIRHKNSEKGPTFSSKIPERVNRKTIQWHTPVWKYHESLPPGPKIKESTTYQPTVTATTIHSLENASVFCCDNICNCLNGSMKIAAWT